MIDSFGLLLPQKGPQRRRVGRRHDKVEHIHARGLQFRPQPPIRSLVAEIRHFMDMDVVDPAHEPNWLPVNDGILTLCEQSYRCRTSHCIFTRTVHMEPRGNDSCGARQI